MGMRIIIFDVDHGFCAFVRTPTRRSILIDCGCKTSFSPIVYLVEKEMRHCVSEGDFTFTNFILTHPHGDHLQDIDKLCEYPPKTYYGSQGLRLGKGQRGELIRR